MRRQRGYTLVEVLIAVTVFAILAGSVYAALNTLSQAAFVHRERSVELAELQRGLVRLETDLRQLAARPARGPDGQLMPALAGQGGGLEGTRAGWANPQQHRRSQLQRFAWSAQSDQLVRTSWPVTDRTPATPAFNEEVLAGLQLLEFNYYSADGRWLEQWPENGASAELPRAVRYRLETDGFGLVERIIVLP
ncbi:MAG: type II secretion system protein GspJ [Wenzhouxiangella sp.]|nr:MAG: type II secretion system protein GspJ [Wenzhouxiangella sp.]